MTTPEQVVIKGKQLALRMMDAVAADEYDPPVLIHALAFMFAALLSATDGETTIHEQMGLGLLGDEERLALFRDEVKELTAALREQRPTQPKTH